MVESPTFARTGLHTDGPRHTVESPRSSPPTVEVGPNFHGRSTDPPGTASEHEHEHEHDDVASFCHAPRDNLDGATPHERYRATRRYRPDDDIKDQIRRRDKFEREVNRVRAQRERLDRRSRGRNYSIDGRRQRTPTGTRRLGAGRHLTTGGATALWTNGDRRRDARVHQRSRELPTATRVNQTGDGGHVAAHPSGVKRFAAGPLHGTALALYFVLLPFVVASKWELAAHQSDGTFIRMLLVALGLFWLLFLIQLGHNVARLRRGLLLGIGGSAWLASLLVALLSFLTPSGILSTPAPLDRAAPSASLVARSDVASRSITTARYRAHLGAESGPDWPNTPPGRGPLTLTPMSAVPLALMAKRRRDVLRERQDELHEDDVDRTIELLRSANPLLVAHLRHLIGDRREGLIRFTGDFSYAAIPVSDEPLAVSVVSDDDDGVVVAFAREGGQLQVPKSWNNDDIASSVIGLHDSGRLSFALTEGELLRTLATRTLRNTLVLYLGAGSDLDDALRACSITVIPLDADDARRRSKFSARFTSDPLDREVDGALEPRPGETRVDLLRADPTVVGLREPFTPALRRRCIEMVAYLALHHHESVTGERLRTRVLAHSNVDASLRTLANTASAVRRSLGVDEAGPRLHPVTSSGLYVTHGVSSDVEIFHALVDRARPLPLPVAAPLLRRALSLVGGEPLASSLRGFEWFLVEGHAARLVRAGEWAALALHQHAVQEEDFELAFWALQKGRLIDPYSDALSDALTRVPRLRQFGGDGSSRAQHEAVGARGAVTMGGALRRLSDQITE